MKGLELDADRLRALALPMPEAGSKDDRGSVLVVGGTSEVPGAALLAGIAALRVGAGKLKIATVRSVAAGLALAVPEAMVIGLSETDTGEIEADDADGRLASSVGATDAVLIGPGTSSGEPAAALALALVTRQPESAFVLDAGCVCGLAPHAGTIRALDQWPILTPHAGEMAKLLDRDRDEIESSPREAAIEAAERLRAVVIMKGAGSWIVAPDGECWHYPGGGVGLATSGSGDVLSGLIAGLRARGADPLRSALWGVFLHGEAGTRLARTTGPLGFLARDLSAEVPQILAELSAPH